jgi:hypothetical protein
MEEKIKKVKPRTAKPATPSPITVPPPKETFACGKLVRAACVVLTFVLLLFSFPFPAKAEKKAPKTKATTINICVVGTK